MSVVEVVEQARLLKKAPLRDFQSLKSSSTTLALVLESRRRTLPVDRSELKDWQSPSAQVARERMTKGENSVAALTKAVSSFHNATKEYAKALAEAMEIARKSVQANWNAFIFFRVFIPPFVMFRFRQYWLDRALEDGEAALRKSEEAAETYRAAVTALLTELRTTLAKLD